MAPSHEPFRPGVPGVLADETSPCSPNHERIQAPWRLAILLRGGASVEVHVGNGNRPHPEAVWLQFGVEVYQNPRLREGLRAADVELWPEEEARGEEPDER